MQKLIYNTLLLATAGTISTCLADANPQPAELPTTTVTATRSEMATEELATANTVLTRSDIERLQVKTLPELLRTAPGIDMVQNGGYGQTSDVYLRGTNSNHILVLIDGIRAGSVSLGSTAFQLLPIDQIERVEITRGPNSSFYGSEAIGGVIQIFTRKGRQNDKPSVSLDAGAGSFDTASAAGSVSGNAGNSWYALGASHLTSQGINVRSIGNETDRDAYDNTGVNARAGHRFANDAEVEAFFMRGMGKTEFDGTPNNMDFVNQTVGLSSGFDIMKNWRSNVRLGQTEDQADNFTQRAFYSRFNTTRWNASWLNEIQLDDNHQLTLGSDYRVDEIQSTVRYSESSRYDVGVFGAWHGRLLERHFLNASLRWDQNQTFGERVTGNFGWRFNWDYGLSAFASFGNAFKAPTFNDLYWPYNDSEFGGTRYISVGNPNLKPEESTSFEAGVAGNHKALQWQLRAYHTNIDNLIDWAGEVVNPTTYRYQPQNVDKAQIDGLESEFSGQVFGWRNQLNMSLLSPRNRVTNLDLARRAEQILTYDISRSFDAVDVGLHVLASGGRFDDRANSKRVEGFATVDLRSAVHLGKHWSLSAKLNNLLDKQYQTVDTYNTFGRNFFFTIHYNN